MPSVSAGLKWPPDIGPTANAIAITERPTANATAISPADGAENSAAPQTPVTSANVPTNSAPSSRADMIPPNDPAAPGARSANHMVHQLGAVGNGVEQALCVINRARLRPS